MPLFQTLLCEDVIDASGSTSIPAIWLLVIMLFSMRVLKAPQARMPLRPQESMVLFVIK